jgi:hypothetical protein
MTQQTELFLDSSCLNFWNMMFIWIVFENSVRTSQEAHYVSTTNTNRLTSFKETVAVYCENYMEHTTTICGQNAML